jgi:hypothetical protein
LDDAIRSIEHPGLTRQPRKPVLTGGCQCGAVRYALYAQPENIHICHCRMCQKAVGGPFAGLVPVRRTDFTWTRGTPEPFRSSTIAERDFCRNCGTPLTFRYIGKEWISVTVGSLDEPSSAAPTAQYGTESRISWLDQLASLPGCHTEADICANDRLEMHSFQHPDHDTPRSWQPPRPAPRAKAR